jgi:hypothetical protein
MRDPSPISTRLAGEVTVGEYIDKVKKHGEQGEDSRKDIAQLIRKRFEERYLEPILGVDEQKKHGFAMLAICCLMVEAMESFRNGWKETEGRSENAFCSFFQIHDEFRELRPLAHEFYRAVRCGILHQAETTSGWRIHRDAGKLLEQQGEVRWLSAAEFGSRLRSVLKQYCDDLATADWGGTQWIKARKNLRFVCINCGVPKEDVPE